MLKIDGGTTRWGRDSDFSRDLKWILDTKVVSLETAFGVKPGEIGKELGVGRNPCGEIFLGEWQECVLPLPTLEEVRDVWADDLVLEA